MLKRFILLTVLTFTLSGCNDDSPERMKAGDQLYGYYCQQCHVKKGLGANMEHISAERRNLKDYEIVLMIKYGYQMGHEVNSFSQLSDDQAQAIATHVVKLMQEQN